MARNNFSPAEETFIRNQYPEHGLSWVSNELGKPATQIKTFVTNNKIVRINYKHKWTDTELEKLKQDYPHRRTDVIASEMGLAYHVVTSRAHRIGLKKSDAFLRSPECNRLDGKKGSSFRFEKGHTPANKGVSMSEELRDKVKGTWFKPEHLPANIKYDGYISTRIDSHGHPYQYIRIEKGKSVLLHRHNWEKVNGPIPADKILRARDNDSLNCDPDNWELIDRAEHLGKNSGREELTDNYILAKLTHRAPHLKAALSQMPELIELKRTQIKLKRTINELNQTSTND